MAPSRKRLTQIEALKEAAAATTAIFVHSVLMEEFHSGMFSRMSFLFALIAAAMVWLFCNWSLGKWMAAVNREDDIGGCWGDLIRKGSPNEPATEISILNIYEKDHDGGWRVEGRSLDYETFTETGSWQSDEGAYDNSMLLYFFRNQNLGVMGQCAYTFQRSRGTGSPPDGYTGTIYEDRDPPQRFKAAGKKLRVQLAKLHNREEVKSLAEQLKRDFE